jgi:hypothetical protein
MARAKNKQVIEDVKNEVKEASKEIDSSVVESEASDTIKTHPESKTEAISRIVDLLSSLTKDDAINCFDLMIKGIGKEAGGGEGNAQINAASVRMKGAVKEDIAELFGSEELSEEFKEKTATLFESAVNARLQLELEDLKEALAEENQKKIDELTEELQSKIDSYLTYVAEDWVSKNEVAIESTLKQEITEEFISDFIDLCQSHNINLPDSKVDVVEELVGRLEEIEARLDETLEENAVLTQIIKEETKAAAFKEISEGLSVMQAEQLRTLSEDIEYDDLDEYANKLNIIKEHHFKKNSFRPQSNLLQEDYVDELEEDKVESKSGNPVIHQYAQALKALNKKQ